MRGDPPSNPLTIEKGNSWCEIVTRLPMPNPELMVLSHDSSGKRKWLSTQGAEFPSSVHQLVCMCPARNNCKVMSSSLINCAVSPSAPMANDAKESKWEKKVLGSLWRRTLTVTNRTTCAQQSEERGMYHAILVSCR